MKINLIHLFFLLTTFMSGSCDQDILVQPSEIPPPKAEMPQDHDGGKPSPPVKPVVGKWNDFSVSDPSVIDQAGVDMQGYWPDGKISVVEDAATGRFALYWGEKYSFRTEAESPFPEGHINQLKPSARVFGIGFDTTPGFTDGGAWFIGVHRLLDGRLAGFFHAESGWGSLEAYKSIGVAYSSDNGQTWTKGEKILSVEYPKPSDPRWSGLGDACVVYDEKRRHFMCYYSAYIHGEDYKMSMAVSNDPAGAPGTWQKWDGQDFTITGTNPKTGTGGTDHKIVGLSSHAGANPSVMWNRFLERWVMVYAGWDEVLYMSASVDGITWERPIALSNIEEETARYPNLIGATGDLVGGREIKMYYGRNQNQAGIRQFAYRTITYNVAD